MYQVKTIQAFNDNYIWCLVNESTNHCVLVDPGDAKVCIDFIRAHQLQLDAVLITHHHQDHTGGLKDLIAFNQDLGLPINIYGPTHDPISQLTKTLVEDDKVKLFSGSLTFNVIDIPGHTLGHIAFFNDDLNVLFCGDTLFSGGCGRIFEGTALQMHTSLQKLAALPNDTKVYCAHEYTQANINFALSLEPDNTDILSYNQHVIELRQDKKSTIPTTIGLEKKINPFLRCDEATLKNIAQQNSNKTLPTTDAVFAIIRQLKDNF